MTTEMQFHKDPINLILSFKKPGWGLKKKSSPLDGLKTYMKPVKRHFDLLFHGSTFPSDRQNVDVGKYFKNISYSNRKFKLMLNDFYLREMASPWVKGQVSFFYTKGFAKNRKYYYRLIIPLERGLNFHYQLEERFFDTDLGYHSREGTAVNIDRDELTINVIRDKNKIGNYLIIQSKTLQNYDVFSEKTYAIVVGLGYITGHLAGNNGYFFAYTQKEMKQFKHFYFAERRPTLKSSYTPIYTNPYGYLKHRRKLAENYYKKSLLRPISIAEFSVFCQRLHDSIDFSSAILLILESSVATLLFMPGGFAIVLEALSDIIMAEDRIKLSPIKDKATSRLIRKECSEIINENSKEISPDDLKALLGRIEHINQPTNKARLRAPFDKLKIQLSDEDLAILSSRNDFLHGRIPDITGGGTTRPTDRKNRDLYYASMRFYTLLNILLLKWIGYDNYVLNHPKIQEQYCRIKLKEPYYRKV